MRPQLLIVEMLLADANARFTNGDIDGGCRMIGQAALIMEQMTQPEALVLAVAVPEPLPVAEVLAVATPVAPEITIEELAQVAETGAMAIQAAQVAPIPPALPAAQQRPRARAAAA